MSPHREPLPDPKPRHGRAPRRPVNSRVVVALLVATFAAMLYAIYWVTKTARP